MRSSSSSRPAASCSALNFCKAVRRCPVAMIGERAGSAAGASAVMAAAPAVRPMAANAPLPRASARRVVLGLFVALNMMRPHVPGSGLAGVVSTRQSDRWCREPPGAEQAR